MCMLRSVSTCARSNSWIPALAQSGGAAEWIRSHCPPWPPACSLDGPERILVRTPPHTLEAASVARAHTELVLASRLCCVRG
ncbi:hypothetical protein C8Q80DRAFT_1196476 [Daedaleopsis nitida]|nr:hypothetical protein C8Q80DRAFT_1196476 [Daedaleopsis nitida]